MSKSRIRLGVNIDHVATLRQARGTVYPNVLYAALVAEQAGADLITIHLREDRRHIQDRDALEIRAQIRSRLNLELAIADETLPLAERIRPDWVCLVPERRQELTTEGGLDVATAPATVARTCAALADLGIRVSLFVDPEPEQIDAAAGCGCAAVELHTGRYADAPDAAGAAAELQRLATAADRAAAARLGVHAGHGLHEHNVLPVAALQPVAELNIGHALVARAVFTGLGPAVAHMRGLLDGAVPAAANPPPPTG